MSNQTTPLPIPEGAVLFLSFGSYSDYCVAGVFRALAKIDAQKFWAEYAAEGNRGCIAFASWLTRHRLIEPLDSWELHVDDGLEVDHYPAEAI